MLWILWSQANPSPYAHIIFRLRIGDVVSQFPVIRTQKLFTWLEFHPLKSLQIHNNNSKAFSHSHTQSFMPLRTWDYWKKKLIWPFNNTVSHVNLSLFICLHSLHWNSCLIQNTSHSCQKLHNVIPIMSYTIIFSILQHWNGKCGISFIFQLKELVHIQPLGMQ